MIFTYGCETAWLYQIAFSDRRQPNHPTFSAVHHHIAETGPVAPQTLDRERPRSAHTPDNEEHVLRAVRNDPGISTCQVALACHTSHSTAWRVLQEQLLYLYHLQSVQGLLHSDYSPQEKFCQWFIIQTTNCLSLQSCLQMRQYDGITNLHNQHL